MVDLDELMRLHAAATPGPWKAKIGDFESEDGYGTVTAPYVEADGKTICVPFDRDPDAEVERRLTLDTSTQPCHIQHVPYFHLCACRERIQSL